ncbi:MAG: hypothetical protein EXR75_03375 [Myxococcales bacterium]|nr:hypothetical protein [Myxococcales bacterium]
MRRKAELGHGRRGWKPAWPGELPSGELPLGGVRLVAVAGICALAVACGASQLTTTAPTSIARASTESAGPSPFELVETVPEHGMPDDPELANTSDVWMAMLERAKREIAIAQFYVSNAKAGGRLEPVLVLLESAARRGVVVRLLVDAKFAEKYPRELERLTKGGLLVRKLDVSLSMGGVHHAKYLVVDGRDGYLGSANFDWRSLQHIHEIGVRFQSERLGAQLMRVFELDWRSAGNEGSAGSSRTRELGAEGAADGAAEPRLAPAIGIASEAATTRFEPEIIADGRVELLLSPKGYLPDERAWDLDRIVLALETAEREVLVQLLTYETTSYDGSAFSRIDDALRAAHSRGVRVRLLLSHWQTSPKKIAAAQTLARAGIEVQIVRFHEAAEGFIPFARVAHAKYLVVDRRLAWIGTSNFSGDYFFKSRNVSVLVSSPKLAEKLALVFEGLSAGPLAERVELERRYEPPRIAE